MLPEVKGMTKTLVWPVLVAWLFVHCQSLKLTQCQTKNITSPPPPLVKYRKQFESIDKSYIPQWYQGQPVNVYVGFYIESLSSIRPTEMAFEVDLYLRQSWLDERLRHNESRHLTVTWDLAQNFWKPDLYFANAKTASFQDVTSSNQLFLVYPDGHVHYSCRIIASVACNLNLKNYPMDVQECAIKILSYAYTEREMVVRWFPHDPILINKKIKLPELVVEGEEAAYCSADFKFGQTETTQLKGDFSCLAGRLRFRRQLGYHLVQTFIPTFLIVVISWISFWIDPAAIPARISLSFTTLLTLATTATGLRMALPPVAYAKAIDFWIGVCTVFVFAALLEFALVNSLIRNAMNLHQNLAKMSFHGESEPFWKDAQEYVSLPSVRSTESLANRTEPSLTKRLKTRVKNFRKMAKRIDKISRFIFPSLFIIFNVFYWLLFMSN